jgi:hypothetical protein
MMEITKQVEGGEVLPKDQRLKYWFAINRTRIGLALLSLFAFLRVILTFKGHSEAIDFAKTLVDLFLLGGGSLASAGAFKSDSYHEEKAAADVRMASGQFPVYQRRESDKR